MRRINALFNDNADLAALSSQADHLTASQKTWEAVAPDSLKQFTQAGGVKHKRLTVYADNGAVAAKIKMLLPSLLSKLQKQGLEVTSIRVVVQVKSGPEKPAKTLRNLSPQAASSLEKLAVELNGSALGEALSRLARHK
jgi:hypothetical protein